MAGARRLEVIYFTGDFDSLRQISIRTDGVIQSSDAAINAQLNNVLNLNCEILIKAPKRSFRNSIRGSKKNL